MKAAVVLQKAGAPVYSEFKDPKPLEGEVLVNVTASALTHFTKLRALGKHYSFTAQPPFVVGIDGVGKLETGRRVYFLFPRAPFGGMAEQSVVPLSQCIGVPDNVDDVTLAAIADPGMSAWTALETRAKLIAGETVIVNGATGSAGGMAVQIAKHLGAKKVIATGRSHDALNALLSMGADEVIALENGHDALRAAFRQKFEQRVDVVLDYLWGTSAEQLLAAASAGQPTVPVRFVQIGTASAPDIKLSGTVLRSSNIHLLGSGIGSVSPEEIANILSKLMQAASSADFKIATRALPLCQIAEAWSEKNATPRIVLTI